MKCVVFLLAQLQLFSFLVCAQNDTLPKFSVISKNGKITLKWINNLSNPQQITIQRSEDSLKNFFTIFTLPNPSLSEFSYTDKNAPNDSLYYRLFVLNTGNNYFFSDSKKPFKELTTDNFLAKATNAENIINARNKREINRRELYKKTLKIKAEKPTVKKYIWTPSTHVFTAADGNVSINLPDFKAKKYYIKFFDERSNLIFELKDIKDSPLLLDKANFLHSGWFTFELYKNDSLIEKNIFLIARDN
ncbi:MAG TPA: hypothetical protein VFN30_14960 [Chitinophagaceae bacterium]|nr:hypothetical protein [Chitinophagaceae bacterium]